MAVNFEFREGQGGSFLESYTDPKKSKRLNLTFLEDLVPNHDSCELMATCPRVFEEYLSHLRKNPKTKEKTRLKKFSFKGLNYVER